MQGRDHMIQLEANVKNKSYNEIDMTSGETLKDINAAGGYNRLAGQKKDDAVVRQQLQASHLSMNHLKHNIIHGEAIWKGKKFYQPPVEEVVQNKAMLKDTSEIQLLGTSGLGALSDGDDPFFYEEQEKRKVPKVRLTYPLQERILNSRGQSIVYVDYKDRFRAGTQITTDRNDRDRKGLGDLMIRAG